MRSNPHPSAARALALSEKLWATRDIPDGMGHLLDTAIELLGAESGVVRLRMRDGHLVSVVDRGIDQGLNALFATYSGGNRSYLSELQAGRRVILEDLDGPHPKDIALLVGWQAWQATPLMSRNGRFLGILWTHFRQPWKPAPDQLAELDLCCSAASAFVERCRSETLSDMASILDGVVHDSPDAALVYFSASKTFLFNDALMRIHGFPDRASCERALRDVEFFSFIDSRGEPLEHARWPISRAYAGESGRGEYFRARRRDTGVTHSFIYSFGPVRDSSGFIVAGALSLRDVTDEENRLERERLRGDLLEELVLARTHDLDHAREDAEHAALARSRLLAAVSHDLRQPLQALTLWVSLVAGAADADERKQIADRMSASSTSMAEMLDSLLEYSRIARGMGIPQMQDVPVAALFAPLMAAWQREASLKGLALDAWCGDGYCVRSDQVMLGRILGNFVSNALHNTHVGSITLACEQSGPAQLRISVTDTGTGIAPERLRFIFEEHVSTENPAEKEARHFGLGLASAKGLASALGCHLGVQSEPGKGSCFWVDVPRAAS